MTKLLWQFLLLLCPFASQPIVLHENEVDFRRRGEPTTRRMRSEVPTCPTSATSSRCLLGTIVASLFAASMAFAQGIDASIAGTVRDSSGSVLPGVTVTATQTDTGLTRTAVYDEEGRYTISNLPVGPYRLEFCCRASARSCRPGSCCRSTRSPTINAALELGNVEESVTVAGRVAADRDAERWNRHGGGQSARPRAAAQRT